MGCDITGLFEPLCIFASLAEYIFAGIATMLEQAFIFMTTGTVPETEPGSVVFFGEPTGSTWATVWRATWIGSGDAWLLLLMIVLIVLGAQIRAVLSIGGFGQMSTRQRNRRIGKSLILLVFWYPIAVVWLSLVDGLTRLFTPSSSGFQDMLDGMFGIGAGEIGSVVADPEAAGFFVFVAVGVTAFFAFILWALLAIQSYIVVFYVWLIPVVIAFWAWNVPYLSDKAQEYAMYFIPISFIPVALGLFTRFFAVATAENFLLSGGPLKILIAPIVYSVVSLIITWKLFSAGAPWAAKTITVGAGLGLAAGLSAAGAGRFAVASAARGDLSRGITRGALSTKAGPEATIQGDVGRRQNAKVVPGGAVK
jgi:hypothetical protein